MNKFTASVAACNFVFLVRRAQKKKLKLVKTMRFDGLSSLHYPPARLRAVGRLDPPPDTEKFPGLEKV